MWNRHVSSALLLAAVASAACTAGHPRTRPQTRSTSVGAYVPCEGDDLLEVYNPGNQSVEVYAYTGSVGQTVFVGTAARGTTSIDLTPTPVGRRSTAFVARLTANGASIPEIRFRRYCGPG